MNGERQWDLRVLVGKQKKNCFHINHDKSHILDKIFRNLRSGKISVALYV